MIIPLFFFFFCTKLPSIFCIASLFLLYSRFLLLCRASVGPFIKKNGVPSGKFPFETYQKSTVCQIVEPFVLLFAVFLWFTTGHVLLQSRLRRGLRGTVRAAYHCVISYHTAWEGVCLCLSLITVNKVPESSLPADLPAAFDCGFSHVCFPQARFEIDKKASFSGFSSCRYFILRTNCGTMAQERRRYPLW